MNVIEKLTDKGFNGADIHLFLQRFEIGIQVYLPRWAPIAFLHDDLRKQKELDDAHYQEFTNRNKAKWEAASIAADFEKHK